jgi:hypothetical protein
VQVEFLYYSILYFPILESTLKTSPTYYIMKEFFGIISPAARPQPLNEVLIG